MALFWIFVSYNTFMGLLSDFTNFIQEAKSLGDEVQGSVKEAAFAFVESKDEVAQTLQETKTELTDTVSEIKQSVDMHTDRLDDN